MKKNNSLNKTTLIVYTALFVFVLIVMVYSFKTNDTKNNDIVKPKENVLNIPSYNKITSPQLLGMLKDKDFKLVDVHIPEQKHIPGTDKFIPYNRIDDIMNYLPNKNEKIVLYCRSGGMSSRTAKILAENGYTNIYDLQGGMNNWSALGYETIPQGSVNK